MYVYLRILIELEEFLSLFLSLLHKDCSTVTPRKQACRATGPSDISTPASAARKQDSEYVDDHRRYNLLKEGLTEACARSVSEVRGQDYICDTRTRRRLLQKLFQEYVVDLQPEELQGELEDSSPIDISAYNLRDLRNELNLRHASIIGDGECLQKRLMKCMKEDKVIGFTVFLSYLGHSLFVIVESLSFCHIWVTVFLS